MTNSTFLSNSDRVRASYRAQEARRALDDLPTGLRSDTVAFARTGLPAKTSAIEQWLASERGISGAVETYVGLIMKHLPDAHAAQAEFA